MSLHQLIEQHWQHPKGWLLPFLWPLSRMFQALAALRRTAYARGWLRRHRLPCALVVVGNIHAGGVGKTPITAALALALREHGMAVGIVSRGYGRQSKETVVLNQYSTAAQVGDEPLMLHQHTGVPVAVGRDRFQAARALLASYPDIRIIIADDGLQHYALARDMELVVFPAADVGRRLDLLPNGVLREPLACLRTADAVVVSNGTADDAARLRSVLRLPESLLVCHSRTLAGRLYRLNAPQQTAIAADFVGKTVAAVAAIARPHRFFDALWELGLVLSACKALPDHAPLTAADLPVADAVVITEKDAVKLTGQPLPQVWVLPVCAIIPPELPQNVLRLLQKGNEEHTPK